MVCADCDNLTIDFYLASANFRDLGFEEKKQFQKLVNAVMDDLQSGEPQGYFSVPIPIFTFHFRYHESGFCLYDPKTEPGKHLYQPLVRDSPVLIPDGGDEEVGQQQNVQAVAENSEEAMDDGDEELGQQQNVQVVAENAEEAEEAMDDKDDNSEEPIDDRSDNTEEDGSVTTVSTEEEGSFSADGSFISNSDDHAMLHADESFRTDSSMSTGEDDDISTTSGSLASGDIDVAEAGNADDDDIGNDGEEDDGMDGDEEMEDENGTEGDDEDEEL